MCFKGRTSAHVVNGICASKADKSHTLLTLFVLRRPDESHTLLTALGSQIRQLSQDGHDITIALAKAHDRHPSVEHLCKSTGAIIHNHESAYIAKAAASGAETLLSLQLKTCCLEHLNLAVAARNGLTHKPFNPDSRASQTHTMLMGLHTPLKHRCMIQSYNPSQGGSNHRLCQSIWMGMGVSRSSCKSSSMHCSIV